MMILSSVSREALCRAYDVLKAADNSGIKFQDFLLFMEEYQPEKGNFSVMNKYLIWFTDQDLHFEKWKSSALLAVREYLLYTAKWKTLELGLALEVLVKCDVRVMCVCVSPNVSSYERVTCACMCVHPQWNGRLCASIRPSRRQMRYPQTALPLPTVWQHHLHWTSSMDSTKSPT